MVVHAPPSLPGARVDAKRTDGLPTIRPGVDRVPKLCPRCRSTWLGYEEPLGPHMRGMLWCQTCSRSIAWVADPAPRRLLAVRVSRAETDTVPDAPPASAPGLTEFLPSHPASRGTTAPRLIRASAFDRLETCGRACTSEYGHDPHAHEVAGADSVHAAIAARATGDIATGPLLIQLGPGRVVVEDRQLAISGVEYRILVYLALRLGDLCTIDEVVDAVLGTDWAASSSDAASVLRTYMNRLRGRLGESAYLIETEYGRGYRLLDAPLC